MDVFEIEPPPPGRGPDPQPKFKTLRPSFAASLFEWSSASLTATDATTQPSPSRPGAITSRIRQQRERISAEFALSKISMSRSCLLALTKFSMFF